MRWEMQARWEILKEGHRHTSTRFSVCNSAMIDGDRRKFGGRRHVGQQRRSVEDPHGIEMLRENFEQVVARPALHCNWHRLPCLLKKAIHLPTQCAKQNSA